MSEKRWCDFLVITRITGRTSVSEFTENETTQLLKLVSELIIGIWKGEQKQSYIAKYVLVYRVSYEGELELMLSWYRTDGES